MDIDVMFGQINKLKDLVIQLHERNNNLIVENNRLKDENEKLLIDVAFLDGRMEDKRTIF
jgi:regulator of replication initiation timing